MPLALTFGTLSFWLAEIGVSLTAIGLFALVAALLQSQIPLVAADRPRCPCPFLTRAARPAAQLGAGDPGAAGAGDPGARPYRSARSIRRVTALAAVIVAFLSASQDIVIDAYRIELLRPEEQGAGAAATQWGYRFGMLASGAGALYARELSAAGVSPTADGGADAGRHGHGVAYARAGGAAPRATAGSGGSGCGWLSRAVVGAVRRLFRRNGAALWLRS